jgi:hypothetical protein
MLPREAIGLAELTAEVKLGISWDPPEPGAHHPETDRKTLAEFATREAVDSRSWRIADPLLCDNRATIRQARRFSRNTS